MLPSILPVADWAGLEREDSPELIAPRVRPSGRQASEKFAANRRGTRVDVACFLNEGDPLVQPVGQRSRVEIRTGEIVCTVTANIASHRSVGPIRQVQSPSGVVALWIGAEDA